MGQRKQKISLHHRDYYIANNSVLDQPFHCHQSTNSVLSLHAHICMYVQGSTILSGGLPVKILYNDNPWTCSSFSCYSLQACCVKIQPVRIYFFHIICKLWSVVGHYTVAVRVCLIVNHVTIVQQNNIGG